jgi:hypothetical protein
MSGQGDFGYVQDGTYTGGWSGSDASRDRAEREERTGRARHRREQVLKVVRLTGLFGMTVGEVEEALSIGHGHASGALSNLHKAGRLECLKERRGGQHVYVLPHAVNGRATRQFGRAKKAKPLIDVLAPVEPVADTLLVERAETAEAALAAALERHDEVVGEAKRAGYDEGWQAGYDEAMEVARRDRTATTAYEDGLHAGHAAGQAVAARRIYEMASGMQSQMPKTVQTHHAKCWMQHPACALNAVRQAAARMAPEESK